ncbi:hypothetical protein ACFE04_014540 [Oxalis oulophora]
MDAFDQLPDSLILQIFNSVSDVKTLIRCRSISKRFDYLVPQTESLLLNVDRVISPESNSTNSLFSFLINLIFNRKSQAYAQPAQILSSFVDVRRLIIQLPPDDLPLLKSGNVNGGGDDDFLTCLNDNLPTQWQEHPSVQKSCPSGEVKWVAEFGETLKSCVVFGFSYVTKLVNDDESRQHETCEDFERGLKERVVWTISSLMAASSRHCMLKEVVKKSKRLEEVTLTDKDGKGTVLMGKKGLRECREAAGTAEEGGGDGWLAVVKNDGVRMRIRKMNMVRLGDGGVVGATLVVMRPVNDDVADVDAELALKAFGYGEERLVVETLLKSQSYVLEMKAL